MVYISFTELFQFVIMMTGVIALVWNISKDIHNNKKK